MAVLRTRFASHVGLSNRAPLALKGRRSRAVVRALEDEAAGVVDAMAESVAEAVGSAADSSPDVVPDAIALYESLAASSNAAETVVSNPASNDLLSNVGTTMTSAPLDLLTFDNPALLFGIGAAVLVPAALYVASSLGGSSVKTLSAAQAVTTLSNTPGILIDMRTNKERSQRGSPRIANSKILTLPYFSERKGELIPDPKFEDKVERVKVYDGRNLVEREDATVVILDSYGTQAQKVAAVFAEAGFGSCIVVADGAEGPRGWRESGLDWKEKKSFTLPSINITEKIDELAEENPSLVKGALAAGGLVVASTVFAAEVETVVEVVGVLAAANIAAKNFLYATDREKTFGTMKVLADTVSGKDKAQAAKKPPSTEPPKVVATSVDDSIPTVSGKNEAKEVEKEESKPEVVVSESSTVAGGDGDGSAQKEEKDSEAKEKDAEAKKSDSIEYTW